MPGPKQGEVEALAAEEANVLRRRAALEAHNREALAQVRVNRIELEALDRRLLAIRGKLEGVDLGSAYHQELVAAAVDKAKAEKASTTTETPA